MARRSSFPLYDRILGGSLGEHIRRRLAEGRSVPEIRDELRDNHDVDVSTETVRRWIRDLPEPEQVA